MLSVGVLIELWWRPEAGGHVKCWEQFAQAATALDHEIDLTLHFLGEQHQVISLSKNVRYVLHPSIFSTRRLWFMNMSEHTDLAPFNPTLLPFLQNYDVLHATHPLFTFGKTVLYFAKTSDRPLICSVHTDVPKYTQIYMDQTIRTLFGNSFLSHLLLDQWQLDRRRGEAMKRQLEKYWRQCDFVIVSQPDDFEQVAQVLSKDRVSFLRMGIDLDVFHPRQRDRAALQQTYGIPCHRQLLLFVGRLDPCKRVLTVAQAARQLLDQGFPIHVIFIGEGSNHEDIQALLGPDATMLGVLPNAELPRFYASSDLFVFPSESETYGNVVVEAKASGLPVLVSGKGGTGQLLQASGQDGMIIHDRHPQQWATMIATLLQNPAKRKEMGQKARQQVESEGLSWQGVLEQDLLPVWRSVAKSLENAS